MIAGAGACQSIYGAPQHPLRQFDSSASTGISSRYGVIHRLSRVTGLLLFLPFVELRIEHMRRLYDEVI
jgi:hypothetical protein